MLMRKAGLGLVAMATAALVVGWTGVAAAAAVSVTDGTLKDWGVTLKDGSSSVTRYYNPGSTTQCGTDNSSAGCGVGAVGIQYNTNGSTYTGARPNGFQKEDGREGTGFGAPKYTQGGVNRSEDIYDKSTSGVTVDPNRGGQNYDAEWMGTAVVGHTLYIAIASGVRNDSGFSQFGMGDIRIVGKAANNVTKTGEWGIETGGGRGNTVGGNANADFTGDTKAAVSTAMGVGVNALGSTYILDSSGNTTGVVNSNCSTKQQADGATCATGTAVENKYKTNTGQIAGSIFRMDGVDVGATDNCNVAGNQGAWICDTIPDAHAGDTIWPSEQTLNQIGYGAKKVGDALQFRYSRNECLDDPDKVVNAQGQVISNGPLPCAKEHSIIELAFDLNLLGANTKNIDIYWGPACGNDELHIEWPRTDIPAPAGLLVLATSLLGWAALRRRRHA